MDHGYETNPLDSRAAAAARIATLERELGAKIGEAMELTGQVVRLERELATLRAREEERERQLVASEDFATAQHSETEARAGSPRQRPDGRHPTNGAQPMTRARQLAVETERAVHRAYLRIHGRGCICEQCEAEKVAVIERAIIQAMREERERSSSTPAVDCPLPSCGAKAGQYCYPKGKGMQPVDGPYPPVIHAARIRSLGDMEAKP